MLARWHTLMLHHHQLLHQQTRYSRIERAIAYIAHLLIIVVFV